MRYSSRVSTRIPGYGSRTEIIQKKSISILEKVPEIQNSRQYPEEFFS